MPIILSVLVFRGDKVDYCQFQLQYHPSQITLPLPSNSCWNLVKIHPSYLFFPGFHSSVLYMKKISTESSGQPHYAIIRYSWIKSKPRLIYLLHFSEIDASILKDFHQRLDFDFLMLPTHILFDIYKFYFCYYLLLYIYLHSTSTIHHVWFDWSRFYIIRLRGLT